MVIGIVFAVAGVATYVLVANELAAENITVSADAEYFAGQEVNSPWTAYSEAETISKHALKATGGKYEDAMAMAKALRHTKYESTRGPYEYNVNGMPIQNYYKREVVKGADGKIAIVNRGVVLSNYKDAYWEKCPADKRL